MQSGGVTKELLQAFALAQGVSLPDQRLDAVLRQYENYLQSLARMESLPLSREAEPEIIFSHQVGTTPVEPPPKR